MHARFWTRAHTLHCSFSVPQQGLCSFSERPIWPGIPPDSARNRPHVARLFPTSTLIGLESGNLEQGQIRPSTDIGPNSTKSGPESPISAKVGLGPTLARNCPMSANLGHRGGPQKDHLGRRDGHHLGTMIALRDVCGPPSSIVGGTHNRRHVGGTTRRVRTRHDED